MKVCKFCGNIVTKYKRREYCSESCYQKMYYQLNKERKKAYDKAKYIRHPRKITKTKEEMKVYRKKYYEEHKEYYRQKNREHYLLHKNDPEYRRRHNEAVKRYLKRRKEKENAELKK